MNLKTAYLGMAIVGAVVPYIIDAGRMVRGFPNLE